MTQYWPFILFSITMAFTPGPNNTLLMASGLNHGIQKSIPHLLGVMLGFPLMLSMVGFGAGNIFTAYPVLHTVLKIIGIGYLLVLAWWIARSKPHQAQQKRPPLTFLQSALFQWVNPKAWLMAISAVTTYMSPTTPLLPQLAVMVLITFMVGLGSSSTWLTFGLGLKKLLTNPDYIHYVNLVMASLLVASIIPIVIQMLH